MFCCWCINIVSILVECQHKEIINIKNSIYYNNIYIYINIIFYLLVYYLAVYLLQLLKPFTSWLIDTWILFNIGISKTLWEHFFFLQRRLVRLIGDFILLKCFNCYWQLLTGIQSRAALPWHLKSVEVIWVLGKSASRMPHGGSVSGMSSLDESPRHMQDMLQG